MTNKTMIAKAVKAALFGGIAASLAITAPVATAAEEGEEAERMVVTGSRIKRVDIENATPVISITSEDLEDSGRLTVADALRNATFNSFGSFSEQSGSSAQSQATVSLLGAGSNRTLVLLDGKRIPGSPSLGGTAVNLNTIPMAAVERIDVMKDAGSAVYGSDAIAGVINIITKKDYDGVNISGGLGRPSKEGADSETFSVTMGATSDRGNITLAFDHEVVDAVFDKDRPYTAASWNDENGDGIIQAYFETQGVSFYGATVWNPVTRLAEASPLCNTLTSTVPGFVGELGGDAVFGPGGHRVCGYAYANVSANKASINRNSVFVNGNYTVNDDLEFFSRMLVVHNRSFGRYAPPAAPWRVIPAGNPHNPSATTDTRGWFRWYQLGPRDNNVDDHSADYLAGLRGTFGESAEWEVAYHYNHADYKSVGNTYLSYSGLSHNLLRNIPLDSAAGLANMSATTLRNDRNTMHQITAGIGFELGELGGGAAAFYVGGETMNYRYASLVDRQSEAGQVGGSSGNSAARDRDVTAYYAEAALPFTSNFDVNLAARMDDYSDFGSEFSPKVSFSYRPIDSLLLRGSWGEGFRAPTLSELSAADAFSAEGATDYVNCFAQGISAADCPNQQFDTTVQSNANLSAEESVFVNLGAVWNATDDFVVRFDYADVDIENAIGYVSVQNLIYQEMLGIPLTAGTSITRNGSGGIDSVRTISANGASLQIRNVDLELTYKLPVSFGDFNFKWITSKILDYKRDVVFSGPLQDTVGFAGAPSMRSQFTTVFSSGDHRVAWNMDYIKGTYADSTPDVTATSVRLNPTGFIDSLLIHNLAYTYNAGDYGRYTIGARNLLETDLPENDSKQLVYSSSLYTQAHLGRTVYFNFSVDL